MYYGFMITGKINTNGIDDALDILNITMDEIDTRDVRIGVFNKDSHGEEFKTCKKK